MNLFLLNPDVLSGNRGRRIGELLGATVMLVGGVIASVFEVDAERTSLETIKNDR